MSDFLEALHQEIAELERTLESDPRYIKLRKLREVAGLYRGGTTWASVFGKAISELTTAAAQVHATDARLATGPVTAGGGSDAINDSGASEPGAAAPRSRKETSAIREAMVEDIRNYLKGRTGPMRTSDIFEFITQAGYELGGNDPKNNLSAILSRTKDVFVSNGHAGWTLVEDQAPEEGGSAVADA